MTEDTRNMELMRKGFEIIIRNPTTEDWIRQTVVAAYTMVIGYEYIKGQDQELADAAHAHATKNLFNHHNNKEFAAVLLSIDNKPAWVKNLVIDTQFLAIMHEYFHSKNQKLADAAKKYALANHGMDGVTLFDGDENGDTHD